jgi:hypothetical protein
MKTASDAFKIITYEVAELAKKPPMRAGELESVSESPQNLMELLNDIDGIKREIHEKMRRSEAVKQAKSLLTEDAVKAGALKKKLAEIGKIMNAVRSDALVDSKQEEEQLVLVRAQESVAGGESRQNAVNATVRVLSENVTLPWPKLEGTVNFESSAQETLTAAYESTNKRLEEAERVRADADHAEARAKQILEQANLELAEARVKEETATQNLISAQQELTTAYQFASVAAQRRLDAAEFFKRSARWVVFASAFSWVTMAWAVWFALRAVAPLWSPCIASTLIVGLAITFDRLVRRED